VVERLALGDQSRAWIRVTVNSESCSGAARRSRIARLTDSAFSSGFVLWVCRYSSAGTWLTSFRSTSFIGMLPSRRCSGRSSTSTEGNVAAASAFTVGLSVSMTTLSISGTARRVSMMWRYRGLPAIGR
jgi:hypothetical protein